MVKPSGLWRWMPCWRLLREQPHADGGGVYHADSSGGKEGGVQAKVCCKI